MLTRRNIMLGAAWAAIAVPGLAADASAQAFVTAIYAAYVGKNGNGIQFDTDSAARRYFEPSLAALIRKDQQDSARRNEVGALDFDPFVDAQDWDITHFDVAIDDTVPGKAVATVKFTSSGTAKTIMLELVKIKNDWRVNNITWQRDGKTETLRGLFVH
jgi:hypothetical protein